MKNNNYYQSRYTYDKKRTKVWKAICKYIEKFIARTQDKSLSVADIGAGYCDFINNITADKKFAIDTNNDSEKFCSQEVIFYSSIENFAKEGNIVDVIFMSNLLEHLNDRDCHELFINVKSVLRDNGQIIIIQPNYYYSYRKYWDDYTHIKAYSHISLADLLTSYDFKIVHLEKRFLPFTMKSLLPKTYFLTRLYLSFSFRPFAKQMLLIARKNE
jgi:2-polyprenyl-3-methyl-5-hydroxy-6-metoxy-1,4-benzoquinol methylase